jgi:hypothetical protein
MRENGIFWDIFIFSEYLHNRKCEGRNYWPSFHKVIVLTYCNVSPESRDIGSSIVH